MAGRGRAIRRPFGKLRAVSRRVEQGQATRQALVETAKRLFAERGYEATSIDAVLERAGVSRGALYHHFDNKRTLFEAVLDAVESEVAERIAGAAAAAHAEDPVEALRVGCSEWLALARDPVVQRIALIDAPSVVGWERWREIDSRHGFGLLKAALAAAAEDGRVKPESVDVLAHMLLAALIEVALLIARSDDPLQARGSGEDTVDELLGRLLGV